MFMTVAHVLVRSSIIKMYFVGEEKSLENDERITIFVLLKHHDRHGRLLYRLRSAVTSHHSAR
jgi:hypothetical protein